MSSVTPTQAITHPNWTMGAKISVDSATMMNKGLELIEAFHLFPVPLDAIDVLVHPESIVHGMVEYIDGSIIAQLGSPDMVTPIAVSLAWPDRIKAPNEPLDLLRLRTLTFEAVDHERFPALNMSRQACIAGGAAPIVLNAANEVAVEAFLREQIGFMDIVETVERCLQKQSFVTPCSLDDIIEIDREARSLAFLLCKKKQQFAA
jgi:1-deoxy-D-xylulose-5-phosphate reductoisomerase